MNARWHATHPMPRNASLDDRVTWHLAHADHCACRGIPATVAAELRRRERAVPVRSPRSGSADDTSKRSR
jgi:hypothetical protein